MSFDNASLDKMLDLPTAAEYIGLSPKQMRAEVKAGLWRHWTTTTEPKKPVLIRKYDLDCYLATGERKPHRYDLTFDNS